MKDLTFLINPSEREVLTNAGDRMPLGLLYIASELEKHQHQVKVYDLNHQTESKLMTDISTLKPTLIGLSCLTTPMVNESKRLLKRIKNYNEKGRVIIGGYHPSVMPQDFAQSVDGHGDVQGLVDNIITGEGEYAAECLVNDVLAEKFIVKNGVTNLSGVKPARHLLKSTDYNMIMDGHRTSTMITSRGCPNSCVFCGNPNKQVRYHDLSDIDLELEQIAKDGYSAVYFLDDVFTINKGRANSIGIMTKDKGLKFRLTTRANYLDEPLIKSLASKGLDVCSMGVESGNPYILERIGKNQTRQDITNAVGICTQYGVKTKGFFILGLPGETEKTAEHTIRFAEQLKTLGMEYCDFYPLVPFPGTDIWNNADKYGLKIIDRDYTNYLQATKGEPKIVCETKDLKADRIRDLIKEAKIRTK